MGSLARPSVAPERQSYVRCFLLSILCRCVVFETLSIRPNFGSSMSNQESLVVLDTIRRRHDNKTSPNMLNKEER